MTVRLAKSSMFWNVRETPSLAIFGGVLPSSDSPCSFTWPRCGL